VITPASQELVSSFCTAGGAPVIDSIVPKDAGMITQLHFQGVVLWIGIAKRKNGYRNINRYAPAMACTDNYPLKWELTATEGFMGFPVNLMNDTNNSII